MLAFFEDIGLSLNYSHVFMSNIVRNMGVRRAVATTLIGRMYIHIFIQKQLISKDIRRAEHEYMNIHPSPTPINALATALEYACL